MSLGSKELFHSNLLAWFIRHHQPVAQALGLRGKVTVLQEKYHTDLLIRHGQQVTVIENKVFALPDTGQPARLGEGPGAAASGLVDLARAVGRPSAGEPVTLPAGQRKILQAARLDAAVARLLSWAPVTVPVTRAPITADGAPGPARGRGGPVTGLVWKVRCRAVLAGPSSAR